MDTRTGEFWVEDGSHFEPRAAHITVHDPMILDETANDDRSQSFRNAFRPIFRLYGVTLIGGTA